jgi:hypothetical protein
LGSLEELVWLYDQTSPFHFVMGATFVGAETAVPWPKVLDALQRRHPLLRVRIEGDASAYPKFVTDEVARVPLRMGVVDIGWAGEISRELQVPFDHHNAPLIRAVVCGDTTGSTLLLAAHHAIADAISLTWIFAMFCCSFPARNWNRWRPRSLKTRCSAMRYAPCAISRLGRSRRRERARPPFANGCKCNIVRYRGILQP